LKRQPVSILLVDDFEPFRIVLSSLLRNRPPLRIIAEAADGLEAVRKAELLQPDLILLDIGLPNLDGIDAARQIRELVPQAKIVFLTQETSPEIVDEAMRSGAAGYVFKIEAASALFETIERVIQNEQSAGLRGAQRVGRKRRNTQDRAPANKDRSSKTSRIGQY
jgi:DNA-binding NarL/FixJ family response regulator